MLTRETLGQAFKELREVRGLSQREVAERVGVAKPLISQVESGRYVPTLDALQAMFGALDAELVVRLKEDTDS